MIENLINLVKEQAGDAIINNPAIPNERNEEAITATGHSITSGLQNMIAGGGAKDVLRLLSGRSSDTPDNPVVQNLSGGVLDNLMNKFGLDRQSAGNIAGGLVPAVLQKLVSKTNDPNDSSFDLSGILNNLSNGKTQGLNIQNLLSGLDKDGDGDTDLQDVMAMFGGNQQNKGGGLLDSVKGMFN